MATKKEIFINSVKLVPVLERTNIPTALYYNNQGYSFGYEAFENAPSLDLINENFKVELGKEDISNINRRQFETGSGQTRSAHALCNDFVESALQEVDKWVQTRGLERATRVLVAEPIALSGMQDVKDSWLANYRAHLKRILENHFTEVDFLPEPFAVFQYYRYGLRHQLVAQRTKHVALVVDFGGGTFDVSVIETTATGDVSMSGRNSKPLAASSTAVGGFFINRVLAEWLIYQALDKKADKGRIQQSFKLYDEHRNAGTNKISSLNDDHRNFIGHLKRIVSDVEKSKIAICKQIADWRLDAQYSTIPAIQILVPRNPLQAKSEFMSIRLSAYDLRDIFEKKIWMNKLKPAMTEAIIRSRSGLEGKAISIVLLSGGSANIGWLGKLIERDLESTLRDAPLLELQEDFQEIVAKGLAVECARRTYNNGVGDFRSVTYNRLCLAFSADGGETELVRLRPVTEGLPNGHADGDGVLLPSATGLGGFIEKPIRWKFRLNRPPKQKLDYYFMRSSFDHEDTASLFNLEHTVYTPKDTGFDSNILVELLVKEDGTTVPKFVYRQAGPSSPAIEVSGAPFYMDMTFGSNSVVGNAYIGFDFGTSNSSFSYVEQGAVKAYAERAQDKNWQEISNLIPTLPYPVSAPLARFVGETSIQEGEKLGLACFEAFLTLAAYVVYAEYRLTKGRSETKIFKAFRQRSAGPLWAFLRQTVEKLNPASRIGIAYKKLFDAPYYEELNKAVSEVANFKHEKPADLNYPRLLWILGNITVQAFQGKALGHFENVVKKKLSKEHEGLFRIATGPSPIHFIKTLSYSGLHSFSEEEVFLCDLNNNFALSLGPLMFWWIASDHSYDAQVDMYVFDINNEDGDSFKRVGQRSLIVATLSNDFSALSEQLAELRTGDVELKAIEEVRLVYSDLSEQ
ncbi:MAG: hypothetical protein WAW10_03380 [Gallionella sp.]